MCSSQRSSISTTSICPGGRGGIGSDPHLTLVEVDLVPEVLAADYSDGHVPADYRYAHHSDFIRLDALLETVASTQTSTPFSCARFRASCLRRRS